LHVSRLSAIVVTRHPSERALELLRRVRPFVDEVVVAVDDRAGDGGLGAIEPLADTLALFAFDHSIERQWEWIAGLATGDWILWLDDDELPSCALLGSLRSLVEARDVTHYLLRRSWVWPDAASTLAEPPWEPEFSPRLYRSDSALVWYPGILHVPVKHAGPFRWVDEPIYHVDLIVNRESARRGKVERYEKLRPGLRLVGRPQNEAVYLPEDRARPPLRVPVPPEEQAAILRFAGCSVEPIEAAPAAGEPIRGDVNAVASRYRGAVSVPVDHASIEVVRAAGPFLAGIERSVEVRVENRGSEWWPPGVFAVSEISLSYRWYAAGGTIAVADGLRTRMPVGVAPGAMELIVMDVIPPLAEGDYLLGVDLVREHVAWFGCEQRVPVHVRRVPLVGILVDRGAEADAVAVARALTAMVPQVDITLLAADPAATATATGYQAEVDPVAALAEQSMSRLLPEALGVPTPTRAEPCFEHLDVLVIAGTARLTGASGRRAGVALAAAVQRFRKSGGRVLIVDGEDMDGPNGILGRTSSRAAAAVEGRLRVGADEELAAAVSAALDFGSSPTEGGLGLR
jgi:hypothetical protein